MVSKSIIRQGLPRQKQGFTLAEVLTVTFIIGLLSSILVVNWRNNEKMYLVQRVAQEIVQNVHTAQSLALAGKTYGPGTGSEPCLDYPCPYYGVNFSTATKYTVFGDKNGNKTYETPPSDLRIGVDDIFIDPNVEIYSLSCVKNGIITIITPPHSLGILFSVPDGFTIINTDPTISSAIIGVRKINTTCAQTKNCKIITITNTGGITVQ